MHRYCKHTFKYPIALQGLIFRNRLAGPCLSPVLISLEPVQRTKNLSKGANRQISYPIERITTGQRYYLHLESQVHRLNHSVLCRTTFLINQNWSMGHLFIHKTGRSALNG